MGSNLNENGYFQSTKNPELKEHRITLNFRDQYAQDALLHYANSTHDSDLAGDIKKAVENVRGAGLSKKPD